MSRYPRLLIACRPLWLLLLAAVPAACACAREAHTAAGETAHPTTLTAAR